MTHDVFGVLEVEKNALLRRSDIFLKIAKMAKLSQTQAVRLCLQDQLNRNKIKMIINDLSLLHTGPSRKKASTDEHIFCKLELLLPICKIVNPKEKSPLFSRGYLNSEICGPCF